MAFGSFNSKAGSHTVNEINMVPLIDVMLVLLVIFIITAPLLSHSIKINVPQASAQPVEQEPKAIDLAVDADGAMFWNETPISPEALKLQFATEAKQDPQPELRIRADLNTRYEVLARIMSEAKGAGLKRLGFITRPGTDMSAPGSLPGSPAATPAAAEAGAGAVPTATVTGQP
ncbi:ExbD/TolR family protein [Allopusillimonas ginsengisoli]|uniref:ExbD/TolR family protein n=1 Tax=Allopusillimonas ginsengisoli TaxID=453575 RepID=UPI00101EF8D5|nr:biopolymer transporter ExbD [Allopusillimonas ginsengisoli]TEA74253.1 biopolymer transporter ExbD [Allopusillimonas ginsengisoli]